MTIENSELQCRMQVEGTVSAILGLLAEKVRHTMKMDDVPVDVDHLLQRLSAITTYHLGPTLGESKQHLTELDKFLKNRYKYYKEHPDVFDCIKLEVKVQKDTDIPF